MGTSISQSRSLKTRMTLGTLAIFVIGIWSLAYYTSRMLRDDMQSLLGEQQFSTVTFIAADVDYELHDRLHGLKTVNTNLAPATSGNAAALQAVLNQNPVLQSMFNGGVIGYRLDGTAMAEVPLSAARIGVNYMDIDTVAAALKEGKSTIGQPVIGKKLRAPVFGMTVPIRDHQGTVVGAIAGVTNLGLPNFLDKISQGRYGKSGDYMLVAPQQRLIITAADKRQSLQRLPDPGINPVIDRFMQGFEGSAVMVNPLGVEVLVSAKGIPVAGWMLAVMLPTAEAFAPIRTMQQRMLLTALLLTLLAGGLTWWMVRRQLAPMLAAARSLASQADSKQPLQPLPVTRPDEVGDLISGFNRVLAELGQREALLRQILDTSSVAIFLVDQEGRIMQANQRMAEMFGCALAALEGSEYLPLVHPAQRGIARQNIQALLTGAMPAADVDRLFWRADHSEFWGRLTAKRFLDASGAQRGFVAVIADITERRAANDALRASEERNRSITQSVGEAIVTSDRAGNIVSWNHAAEIVFGYTESEVMGQATTLLMPARYREQHLAGMNRIRSGAAHHIIGKTVELHGLRKDASEFPIELTLAKWESSGDWFVTGIIRDITERQAQQTQLKLAAQVFAQSREGIVVTDAQGNIILTNPAFTEISGYTEAEVLGKNPRVLASGRQGPEFYRVMWDAINARGHWAGELWNRRKDGTEYPEWLAITALIDADAQIKHFVGNFSDLSDAKAAQSRIQWLSHFDALTGLPNRALLLDRTMHSISMAQRASEPLTMMLVGIDHFAHINDALGHQLGDALLVEMAKRLGNSVRQQDTAAYLGGKEFVLVLPGTPASGAAHLASELLWQLAEPYNLGNQETTLTVSIGIASYPDNGSDFDALLKSVEIALHRAQANGRDRFQFYSDDMYQQVLKHDALTKALRHAAARDQLQLVYQPLVDLQTGRISGLEALLRWQHPELGAVSPAQFIPLAEEAGLIKGIGEWVLRRACRDIRAWLDKGIKVPPVAVNVSPLQFHDDDLIAQVKNALAAAQVDPALIYLEVTEGALMDDVARSEAMLKELKTMGVKLSLDDFGTGYSSLSYLKRFPFDKVKIDQSFVRDITTNPSDKVIAQVIVSMAHGLGLKVIAEGVETEAQCEIMRTSACDEIQGYFFSRPVSSQAIEELLTEGRQLPPHLLRLRKPQPTLLLVDDEPNIVAALKRLFRRDGHLILTANSGPEGLEVLSRHKVDVIISDQRMPGMTGVEFLRAAKINYPDTIRIVLSGFTELQSVTAAINEGAVYRFLTKPWEDEQLREHVQKALDFKELLDQNQQLDIKIRTTNQELVAANRKLGEILQGTHDQIERHQTSLTIMREALQHVPIPVIGVDDDGLMVFVNAAAERLFMHAGPLLGVALAHALPAIDTAMAGVAENVSCELRMEDSRCLVQWSPMGVNSRSRGRIITLIPNGPSS